MDALREWTAWLLSPQSLWTALWIGLGAFTVVLVLLVNSRLGKSQPLRKCAILAVWFHLLLLIYATSIPIVASRPGGDGQVTINLGMGDVSTQQAAPSAKLPCARRAGVAASPAVESMTSTWRKEGAAAGASAGMGAGAGAVLFCANAVPHTASSVACATAVGKRLG